jgi:hypothetical protein
MPTKRKESYSGEIVMETSTILKQKTNEIILEVSKLFPDINIGNVSIKITEIVKVFFLNEPEDYEVVITYRPETNLFYVNIGNNTEIVSARTCFGALTKWINAEIEFHTKEIEKLVQLNTNLLGLGEKK